MRNESDNKHIKDNEYGITEIPDDIPRKRTGERKRQFARFLKRLSDKRSKSGSRIRLTPVSGGIIVVLVLLVVFIAADLSTGGVLSAFNGRVASVLSRRSSERFSVSTDAGTVYDFEAFDNGYAILTENGISYVSSSGKISAKQQLSYSSPSMEIMKERVILYDRGRSSYSLQRNKSMYAQQAVEQDIIDAAVSAGNNYAVAVRDEKAKSILYGMDEKGKIIYQWNCPEGYITDVAITRSGGKAVVSVIDSENAVLSSKLYILDFEYDSAYAEFTYSDETVLGTRFLSGRKVQVITDKCVYLISGREQTVVYEYGASDICYSDIGIGKYTAVITTDYSQDDTYSLVIFGKGGKLKSITTLSGKVRGLSASAKSVAVLFTDKIETYSRRGKLVGAVGDLNHYEDIVLNGNYVYVLSSDSVKKYPAYGSISAAKEIEDEPLSQ